jgi:uncharacterized protein (TIGR00251 family)
MQVFIIRKNIMELIVAVKVTPQSGKSAWSLTKNKTLHCYLKSAPEKNKANEELISLTASLLKIPKHSITIIKGTLNRYKTLKIVTPLSYNLFLEKVGIVDIPESFL